MRNNGRKVRIIFLSAMMILVMTGCSAGSASNIESIISEEQLVQEDISAEEKSSTEEKGSDSTEADAESDATSEADPDVSNEPVTILCFGDSNTYGFVAGTGERYSNDVVWTGILEEKLGDDYKVINEGQNGRTTAYDVFGSTGLNGAEYLEEYFKENELPDVMVIMLGSNDFYLSGLDAESIANGLKKLLDITEEKAKTDNESVPKIIIASPPLINSNLVMEVFDEDAEPYRALSIETSALYKKIAEERGYYFLDTGDLLEVSPLDAVHLTENGHRTMAELVYNKIKEIENGF